MKKMVLTKREQQLESLIRQGKKNKEIACVLETTEDYVKILLHRLFQKVQVTSRFDLAVRQEIPDGCAVPSSPSLRQPLPRYLIPVLEELCHGKRNKVIATTLVLTEGTVKIYLSRAMNKMGVRTRLDLIKKYGQYKRMKIDLSLWAEDMDNRAVMRQALRPLQVIAL